MRIVLISGAGLSSTSGAPVYNDICDHPLYEAFSNLDNDEVDAVAHQIADNFLSLSPSKIHRECALIERVCNQLDIDFCHYTLNIDVLIEKAGGSTQHVYGDVLTPSSLVKFRSMPQVDLSTLNWEPDDIVFFLGVSEQGLPLAYITSCIDSAGGNIFHYNLLHNGDLIGNQIVGDLTNTFSCAEVLKHIPLPISVADFGIGTDVEFAEFSIFGTDYTIYFTSCDYSTVDPAMIDSGAEQLNVDDASRAFEVKFDVSQNIGDSTYYKRPTRNFSLKELNVLGQILMAYIYSHYACSEVKPSMYVAEAYYPELNAFYRRLANCHGVGLLWVHRLINNPYQQRTSGDFHAFKPTS
ncbi:hypothetical protein [Alteromonas naphthalenivorans]|uniref:Deacetylase sirtuin-type domain-containing protein n=1 Tax=Alteromonas naphthalenivorans TaxID=715451 RepID=F5Z5P8_ALTNA|nr:hypothetical protein [Alteromonas naphthalenivorans]AEF05053.1 hypothetical protein ambt_17755 [Alteromonas naphthalenivorans]